MSAKTSNQPGRRTPLSLSGGGGITKGQPHNNKGGGNSANGHTGNQKQDNKNQNQKTEQQQNNSQKQQTDTKDNPTKVQNKQQSETKIPKPQTSQHAENSKLHKQQNQNDNKKSSDKQQNGVAANNNKTDNDNQQQDKQQNGNEVNKVNEKDNKKSSIQEKPVKDEKEKNKAQEKSEKDEKKTKDDKKSKDDKKEHDLKKDDNEVNADKQDKKQGDIKNQQKLETDNKQENVVRSESKVISDKAAKEQKDVVVEMEVTEEEPQISQVPQKSPPVTPKSVKENKKSTPSKTPIEKTPTKGAEKTPQKSTPTIREVTTAIDVDVEMEPLAVDQSPSKEHVADAHVLGVLEPTATSTPGKILLPKRNVPAAKTDVQLAMQSSSTPERPRVFSQISGRRAIRPITEYTPSKFQSNPQFRESYRRINTELDATNTSMNVTVGSEVPNNSSFSFFGRGRKRDRTPPQHSQSAIGELPTDMDLSPPKRARLDFFTVVSSPLTLLRNRFSKANLQSSTPVKLQLKADEPEDDVEVQNVSGVSVHEDIDNNPEDERENTDEGDTTLGVEATADNTPVEGELEIGDNGDKEFPSKSDKQISEDGDIKITETPLQFASGDAVAKNKRCIVM